MIALFSQLLKKNCGFPASVSATTGEVFIYIDDATFSGNRIKQDLERWIKTDAPSKATVHIVTIAMHANAKYYVEQYKKGNVFSSAKSVGKEINLRWWRKLELEDRPFNTAISDVLRPVTIPDDEFVNDFVNTMQRAPVLRKPGHIGQSGIYSSDAGRQLLEAEFLKAGARIRQMCPQLNQYQRPLGNMVLDTLGFGSLIVTFRNCPNNAPLALWADDPWYPLFPRTTNSATASKRFMEMLAKEGF
jgi:hypothetical protein